MEADERGGASSVATIAIVLAMHLTQAIILLIDVDSVGGIALSALLSFTQWMDLGGRYVLATLLLLCAGCTVLALLIRAGSVVCLLLMLPQQALLTVAAGGAVHAIIRSSYADNVLRSHGFILADQLPLIVILATHTVAIVRHAQSRR